MSVSSELRPESRMGLTRMPRETCNRSVSSIESTTLEHAGVRLKRGIKYSAWSRRDYRLFADVREMMGDEICHLSQASSWSRDPDRGGARHRVPFRAIAQGYSREQGPRTPGRPMRAGVCPEA